MAKESKHNGIRGSGIALDFEKLRIAGWTIGKEERKSSSRVKIYLRYPNPDGKALKSAKDIEWQLRDEETTETIVDAEQEQNQRPILPTDYEPLLKELCE